MTVRPSFFFSAPDMAPRMVCACQPVAATISSILAPPSARSMSTSTACLVPARGVPDLTACASATAGAGSAPFASSPAAVAISVVPWPSPVSRQRGSLRRRSASASSSQPQEIIMVTTFVSAAPRSPSGSGRARLPGRVDARLRIRNCVWVSFVMVASVASARGMRGLLPPRAALSGRNAAMGSGAGSVRRRRPPPRRKWRSAGPSPPAQAGRRECPGGARWHG